MQLHPYINYSQQAERILKKAQKTHKQRVEVYIATTYYIFFIILIGLSCGKCTLLPVLILISAMH